MISSIHLFRTDDNLTLIAVIFKEPALRLEDGATRRHPLDKVIAPVTYSSSSFVGEKEFLQYTCRRLFNDKGNREDVRIPRSCEAMIFLCITRDAPRRAPL